MLRALLLLPLPLTILFTSDALDPDSIDLFSLVSANKVTGERSKTDDDNDREVKAEDEEYVPCEKALLDKFKKLNGTGSKVVATLLMMPRVPFFGLWNWPDKDSKLFLAVMPELKVDLFRPYL